MAEPQELMNGRFGREIVEAMIRVGVIAFLVVIAFRIFSPFVSLMLWALILAVALYPLHQRLARSIGGRNGLGATIIVLIGLLLIGMPTVELAGSFAGEVHELYDSASSGSLTIEPPAPSVAEWPVVGERVYALWSEAATDMAALIEKMQPQIGDLARAMLGFAASTMGGVLLFLAALIVAGVMMAFGESGSDAMRRIFIRFSGASKGPELHALSTATIRSVATGVIGVAFIQALVLGVGFVLCGVPGAGILAVIALLLGIVQLPPLLVTLPVIAFLWTGDTSTTAAVIWTIFLLLAGASDNVLKPLLLGRGVAVPMPVVLIGALGGLASAGLVGLFLGAVILSVGYQIFMDWVDDGSDSPAGSAADEGETASVES